MKDLGGFRVSRTRQGRKTKKRNSQKVLEDEQGIVQEWGRLQRRLVRNLLLGEWSDINLPVSFLLGESFQREFE